MKTRFLIAVGTLPPPVDGQSIAFEAFVDHLDMTRRNHRVIDIAVRSRSGGEPGTLDRLRSYLFKWFELLGTVALHPGALVYLTIAQSLRGLARDAAFIAVSKLFRCPVVCHLHGGNYDGFYERQGLLGRWVIRRTLRASSAIVILGNSLRSMFDFDPRLAPRLRVVANSLPVGAMPVTTPKHLPGSPSAPIRILYLSNLIESKGYLTVLEAVRVLRDRFDIRSEAHFCGRFLANPSDDRIVTSTEHARRHFSEEVERLGLRRSVTFHGAVGGERKIEQLRAAHFLVLPTRYDNEGQPISILEAMAFATPVISTDYRAIPDLISDGETGYLVGPDDAEGIASRIAELCADTTRYTTMSQNAMDRVKTRFSLSMHLKRLDDVLEEVG